MQVEAPPADELEDVSRRAQRLFSMLDLGDVVTDREHAAIRQRVEGEFDQRAVSGAPRVTAAFRIADARGALRHDLLDVDVGAVVAPFGHVPDAFVAGHTRAADIPAVAMEVVELLVDELDVEVLVEELDGLIHVVEHDLHRLPRPLGVGARGLRRFLGGGERFLAFLQFGDVAVDAENGAVVERLVADLDVMAAGRPPLKAHAARYPQVIDLLSHLGFDVLDRAEVAAFNLEAPHVAHHAAGNTTSAG